MPIVAEFYDGPDGDQPELERRIAILNQHARVDGDFTFPVRVRRSDVGAISTFITPCYESVPAVLFEPSAEYPALQFMIFPRENRYRVKIGMSKEEIDQDGGLTYVFDIFPPQSTPAQVLRDA